MESIDELTKENPAQVAGIVIMHEKEQKVDKLTLAENQVYRSYLNAIREHHAAILLSVSKNADYNMNDVVEKTLATNNVLLVALGKASCETTIADLERKAFELRSFANLNKDPKTDIFACKAEAIVELANIQWIIHNLTDYKDFKFYTYDCEDECIRDQIIGRSWNQIERIGLNKVEATENIIDVNYINRAKTVATKILDDLVKTIYGDCDKDNIDGDIDGDRDDDRDGDRDDDSDEKLKDARYQYSLEHYLY